jgi:hypothetical protein
MLKEYLEKLEAELEASLMNVEAGVWALTVGEERLNFKELSPGFLILGTILEMPTNKQEDLFMTLCKANFLGQGTGPTRIGMSLDEKLLTLSLPIPYEVTYTTFREKVEEFLNFLLYWRNEIQTLQKQEGVL